MENLNLNKNNISKINNNVDSLILSHQNILDWAITKKNEGSNSDKLNINDFPQKKSFSELLEIDKSLKPEDQNTNVSNDKKVLIIKISEANENIKEIDNSINNDSINIFTK